jgi:ATP-dependent helicase/nuclease subunit B
VSFELLVGPPGSGKTHALLERARELTGAGGRVWWVGLPSQRAPFYRRATRQGALLGLEFQTLQQVYYRMLAHARLLTPLVVGTGRLALVGEALAQELNALPVPGEARLFAVAIAEAKRFGLGVNDIPPGDAEVERLRRIYASYERLKGATWDYDDFRWEALALAEAGAASGASLIEADALFVDGLREVGPLDLRLLLALSESCEVRLALPEAPAGHRPDQVLPGADRTAISVFEAPNPVAESRWVMRALKRDLAEGFDPLDLAVVLPEGESVAFAALADEYGVPVMDEHPTAMADTLPGRLLLELLELPEYPTAARLLPIRELAPLASAALDAGVAGHTALSLLAGRLGLEDAWRRHLAELEVPEDRDAWAAALVQRVLVVASASAEGNRLPDELFRGQALARAKEAGRVAAGPGMRAWWAALLKEASISPSPPGGVALLDERLASGRRYRRAYLLRAVEGSYGVGEREDYFVPEEGRVDVPALFRGAACGVGLPRRFAGRDRLLFAEMRSLADELTITFPRGDQGGPLLAEPELIAGLEPQPLPSLPAGSRLELAGGEPYRAPYRMVGEARQPGGAVGTTGEPGGAGSGEAVTVSVEDLRRYDECAMRFWLERQLIRPAGSDDGGHAGDAGDRDGAGAGGWPLLVAALRERTELGPERLAALARRFPWAAEWLRAHRDHLQRLTFGVTLPAEGPGPRAQLHGAMRAGGEAALYLFVRPGAASGADEAAALLDERWNELWAAGYMLRRYRGRIERVQVVVWPVLGDPVEAYPGGIRYPWKRIANRMSRAQAALERYRSGSIEPSPGYLCRGCPVRDVCREGVA